MSPKSAARAWSCFQRPVLSSASLTLALLGLGCLKCAGQGENIEKIVFRGANGSNNGTWYGQSHWYQTTFIGGGGTTTIYYSEPAGTENRTQIINAQVELTPVQAGHYDAVTGKYFDIENSNLSIHGDVTLRSKFAYMGSGIGSGANVRISGSNALWEITGANDISLGPSNLYIAMANDSQSTLTIENGATVQLPSRGVSIGSGDRSTGTLNIGNYDRTTTGGTLSLNLSEYGYLTFGNAIGVVGQDGQGILNFNQTDTVNFSPRLKSAKPGLGQIVQRGTGTTLLNGDNSAFTGQIRVESGTLWLRGNNAAPFYNIVDGALRVTADHFNSSTASISGGGTLQIGAGSNGAGGGLNGIMIFAMSGGLIDLDRSYNTFFLGDPVSFAGSNGGNENWFLNKSSLRVGFSTTFWGNEGHIRVDALSGMGTIRSGYAGLGSFTFGVNNGSGTFGGQLGDEAGSGHIGRYIKEGWGTQILTGVNTFAGGLTVNGGYVQVSADTGLGATGGAVTLNGGGIKYGAAFNLRPFTIGNNWGWIDTNGFNPTYTQNISGPGALTKVGGGTLTLTGNNTQGGLVIQGGTVSVANDASLAASGATVTVDGGVLALTASVGTNRPLTVGNNGGGISVSAGNLAVWNGNVSGGGDATLSKNDPGTLWVGGDIALGSITVNGGSLVALGMLNLSRNAVINSGARLVLNYDTGGGGGDRYYSGNTSFSGAGTLTKTGDGHVHWGSSAATFALGSGSLIDVQAGAFSGGNDANEDWWNNKSDLRVENGATFHGNEAYIRVDALVDGFFGGGTIRSGWSGAGSITVGVGDGSGTFSGTLVDTDKAGDHIGSLVKEGTGTQTLTGHNTYTGPTIVIDGALVLTGDTKSPTFTLGFGAATLEFNLASDRDYGNVTFDGFGILKKTGSGRLFWGTGAATFALNSGSRIDVQGGTFTGGSHDNEAWTNNKSDLNVAAGATFDGVEAHVRVDALTGGGTITSGYSPVGPGSITFGVDNGSGTFSGVLANGSNPGRYIKAGTGTQILTGANTYTGGTTIAAGTLQIGDGGISGSISGNITNNGALVFDRSGNLTYGQAISGTGTLTKRGTGTLTLTGANTFSGGTTVTGGTLQLGSSGTNLPDIGGVHVSGGTLALGASVEIIGSLALDSQGALLFDLSNAASYERLTITNGLTLSGGMLRLALSNGYVPSIGATFDLLDWGGTFTGAFASLDLPAGITWDTSNLYTNGTLSVVAVPEPAALSLVLPVAILLTNIRRRRRML